MFPYPTSPASDPARRCCRSRQENRRSHARPVPRGRADRPGHRRARV